MVPLQNISFNNLTVVHSTISEARFCLSEFVNTHTTRLDKTREAGLQKSLLCVRTCSSSQFVERFLALDESVHGISRSFDGEDGSCS